MTEDLETEYYYEEETIVDEDLYDEISLLSTIWEESSKDLTVATRKTTASRLRDTLAELSIHQSKEKSPTDVSKKQSSSSSQTISLGSFLEERQQDSPPTNSERPSTTDTKSNDIFRKPLSLDSFVIHTKSPHQQQQQQPRYPKQPFCQQRQHSEEMVSPLSMGDKSDHDKCRVRLGSFLDSGQQALVSPPTNQETLSLKDAKVALLSLLTGEVVIPQEDDDDEFTYVSYLSEGTSLASETISLVGEDGNKSTRGSPEKGGPSDTSSQGGGSTRSLIRKSSFGSVSLGISLGAIAEDEDDDDDAE
eukprot:Nitzschia sp. Nitz4//scaffold158_size52425//38084//38998//NITZ4_006861-RA/size52425-processed-gene-0.31-mRNA-1//-1//CDS//3329537519//124//frame0